MLCASVISYSNFKGLIKSGALLWSTLLVMTSLFQVNQGAVITTTTSGLEIAPYSVSRTAAEGYEERVYPARKWVMTQMQHTSRDSVSMPLFGRLFNYISGQNDKQVKINMTAPVSMFIQPGTGPSAKNTFTMAFYIPSAFQNKDTPKPTNTDVSIEDRGEFKVFVRTYGGFSDHEMTLNEHTALLNSLSEEDKKKVDPSGPFYSAGYDAPFTLLNRRNEIWLPLKTNASKN